MDKGDIQNLIINFVNKEANVNELEELSEYLKEEENITLLNHFVRIEYLISLCMAEYDLEKAKKTINQRLINNSRRRRIVFFRKIAACVSILLILGISLIHWNETEIPVVETQEVIKIGSDKAILTLENGNQVALEKGRKYETGIANSDGEELVYADSKELADGEPPAYNYLTIPRGGQFMVKLSDGTKVWLNSDSKLKYPVKFSESGARQVELVYGEAYFDVSHSSNHNGAHFNVITKSQLVDVLGTEFNIKAYDEDDVVKTTLVEGEIFMKKGKTKKILKPNQQARIRHSLDVIDVIEIDASQEISWKDGFFAFNEESLEEIMKALSRWYDVDIVFELAKHKDFVFTGVLERTKSINDVLKLIEATSEGEMKFVTRNKTIVIR